ncbi:MAG: helix-turn-helix transcriptional regulator [Proteobacteria bacterium]|nr:helix-turn-helix transcriptional regulator [Pseudomonadota bacterium]
MPRTGSIPDPIDEAIGRRLRLLRSQKRLTQTQLGEAIGVTFQQIQKYERGANRISAASLIRAAAVLGTTAAALAGEAAPGLIADTSVLEFLTHPQAPELLAAYAAVERPEDRSLILRLAEALSRPGPDWGSGAASA